MLGYVFYSWVKIGSGLRVFWSSIIGLSSDLRKWPINTMHDVTLILREDRLRRKKYGMSSSSTAIDTSSNHVKSYCLFLHNCLCLCGVVSITRAFVLPPRIGTNGQLGLCNF